MMDDKTVETIMQTLEELEKIPPSDQVKHVISATVNVLMAVHECQAVSISVTLKDGSELSVEAMPMTQEQLDELDTEQKPTVN